jgi:hypothetical protein
MLALQASAGNSAVNQLLAGDAPLQLQRLVYIRNRIGSGWRRKTGRSTRAGHGRLGGPTVGDMMVDADKRFFESKAEMSRWARGGIDTMGYVANAATWVRVRPGSFTVIGENHSAVTMADLAKGLHTDRFRYEAYTENVGALENPDLHAAVSHRKQQKDVQIGSAVGTRAHEAEDLHPKILRSLTGLIPNQSKVMGTPAELRLLGWAILDAATPANAAQLDTYRDNEVALDALAQTLVAMPDSGPSRVVDLAWAVFEEFKAEYTALVQAKVDALRASAVPADVAAFDAHWHLAVGPFKTFKRSGDYQRDPAHEMMQAEKARDLSLFLHMKRAKADGDLLFGVGELHQDRLNRLLESQGIAHTDMTTFIDGQKQRFRAP